MFTPLSLYIGLRYTRAKRKQHFISFISCASMVGIALGVAVLITVLSVMNGFDYEIQHRLFNMANHVTISRVEGAFTEWPAIQREAQKTPDVVAAAPFVQDQGLLTASGISVPLVVNGVLPQEEARVSDLPTYMTQGNLASLLPHQFQLILGQGLADRLGIDVGDKVVLLTPQTSTNPLGIQPRYKRFTVSGIFSVPENPVMNGNLAFIHLRDAQDLYQLHGGVSGLRLRIHDFYGAPMVSRALEQSLPPEYSISNWTEEYGTFFKSIQMEKTMIFLLLLLIIAVAAFNLVSSLVMAVNDKRSDIAILRTFGMSRRTVMFIFMIQGMAIGFVGTCLGFIGGVWMAWHVSGIIQLIQQLFQVQFISASVYFLDYLPSRLLWSDVWQICSIALFMSVLATLYPAWQASRVEPAEALRYE